MEIGTWGHAALRDRLRELRPPLVVLLELFAARTELPVEAASSALGDRLLRACAGAGLLSLDEGVVRGSVTLACVEGLRFASDRIERHRDGASDFVIGPGGVTRRLADLTLRGRVHRVLDLGCGAGVLGARCAAHADRVVATDVNARAVAFTRFNADLNGLELDCREGSLFDPVAGERFDLIVCNPPYVISPASTYTYRDGGTALCRAIVRGAADHLSERGTLQMLAEWPERTDADWRAEVASWLDGARCDAWVLRTYSNAPRDYAMRWLIQEHGGTDVPEDALAAWLGHLAGLGVGSVGGGLLVLRPAPRRRAPALVIRDAPPLAPPLGASLARWLAAQALLADLENDEQILDLRLLPSPDLERTFRARPTGEGWTPVEPELRLRSGLRFGARVDPVAAELIGRLDGRRTPREAIGELAAAAGAPAQAFLPSLPAALRRLIALGLLVPPDGTA
jgi:methylase of polypeptide subunit release factors